MYSTDAPWEERRRRRRPVAESKAQRCITVSSGKRCRCLRWTPVVLLSSATIRVPTHGSRCVTISPGRLFQRETTRRCFLDDRGSRWCSGARNFGSQERLVVAEINIHERNLGNLHRPIIRGTGEFEELPGRIAGSSCKDGNIIPRSLGLVFTWDISRRVFRENVTGDLGRDFSTPTSPFVSLSTGVHTHISLAAFDPRSVELVSRRFNFPGKI